MAEPIESVPSSSSTKLNKCTCHTLLIDGKHLDLTALGYAKKYRDHGYTKGGLAAFQEIERAGLGNISEKRVNNSTVSIPEYAVTTGLYTILVTLHACRH